ncbi:MAG: hypothetical protein L3K26_01925 [Candidatus Hydrogenedentes bacterium]|nr:hypothetical protein [Candidatus Hydrogenedentota bacterium]
MKSVTAIYPGPRGRGAHVRKTACLAVICMAVLVAGCAPPGDDADVLAEIAAGGEHQDWDVTRPRIKAYLLRHPNDILGHYYYGLSYLHMPLPQLTLAEGEFLTTQTLLEQVEEFPEEEAGMERNVFAGQLNRKTALAYMRGYREALQFGLSHDYGQELLRKANAEVELGLQASPSSARLQEYAEFLRQALGIDAPKGPKIITERAGVGISI